MNDDMASIFREELRDLLESLERGLMDLKSRPEDAGLVNQVFRDLHTVKGSGAMFGFSDLAAFIHAFETAFDRVRSGKVPVTPDGAFYVYADCSALSDDADSGSTAPLGARSRTQSCRAWASIGRANR